MFVAVDAYIWLLSLGKWVRGCEQQQEPQASDGFAQAMCYEKLLNHVRGCLAFPSTRTKLWRKKVIDII
jgi:hypothetical protein